MMHNATVARKSRTRVRVALSVSVIGAVFGSAFPANAALITWSTAITFKDDSVLISPTGGYAVSFGPTGAGGTTTGSAAGASVPVTFGEVSALTATISGATSASNIYLNGVSGTPNTTGDTGFDNVVTTSISNGTTTAVGNITLHNLTPATTYKLQLFYTDTRTGSTSGRSFVVSDGTSPGSNTTAFQYAYGASGNTIAGATITGTFTADATVQNFTTSVANGSLKQGTQINALVLAVAPEPASVAIMGLGLAALTLRPRRRSAR